MELTEARRFVRQNAARVPIPKVIDAAHIQCIDGRSRRSLDELGEQHREGYTGAAVAYPAGAIGLPLTVLAAINSRLLSPWEGTALYKQALKLLSLQKIMEFTEGHYGGMSYHTDEHNKHDPIACAGCGHAMGFIRDETDEGYGLGKAYRSAFVVYAKKLKARSKKGESGVVPFTYTGKHTERAVIRLRSNFETDRFISLTPNDGKTSVFIFNDMMGVKLLNEYTDSLYEEFRIEFQKLGVSHDELMDHARSMYRFHLRSSASKLAGGFPVYDVSHDGDEFQVTRSTLKF